MNKNTAFENEGYSWYQDRYEAVRIERNRYFLLLLICFLALIISVMANLWLSPLKTAVPYLIEVNKNTGVTTVLTQVDRKTIQQNEAVTVYFLYKYLNARMTYDYALRRINADRVRALSSSQTYQEYAKEMDTHNPQSPIRRYQNNCTIHLKITGYSFPYANIAQIHFYTEISGNQMTGDKPARQYWQATIGFGYTNAPLPEEDRIQDNPLGFLVTSFQLNEEIPKEEIK